MKKFEVRYTETVRTTFVCVVKAKTEAEAKKKALNYEHEFCDDGDDGVNEDAQVLSVRPYTEED
jgi:hypothetical protein